MPFRERDIGKKIGGGLGIKKETKKPLETKDLMGKSFEELGELAKDSPLHSEERNSIFAEMARLSNDVEQLMSLSERIPVDSEARRIILDKLSKFDLTREEIIGAHRRALENEDIPLQKIFLDKTEKLDKTEEPDKTEK